jgi:hypothetical protein
MNKIKIKCLLIALVAFSSATSLYAQKEQNYKHPYLNASGRVLDEKGQELGWVSKDGIVYNSKNEKIAFIKGTEVTDAAGKKIGKMEKNGTYYNENGEAVFSIESNSKGEQCKIFDPEGKVVASVHESYKNQACAIHCLQKNMPMN